MLLCISEDRLLTLDFFRPGDVRYFVNLMKQTDFKINRRRKQLEEELARWQKEQGAAMESQETDLTKGDADGQTAPSTPVTATKSLSASGSLSLHPSLPPKPGSPVKAPESAKPSLLGTLSAEDDEAVEDKPKPKSPNEDEELGELYEASALLIRLDMYLTAVSSKRKGLAGWRFVPPAKCTCNISGKSGLGILHYCSRK